MSAALAGSYLSPRRLILTIVVSSVVVSVVSALLAPTMSTSGTGNPVLLKRLQAKPLMGSLVGFENIAVAQVDLDAPGEFINDE